MRGYDPAVAALLSPVIPSTAQQKVWAYLDGYQAIVESAKSPRIHSNTFASYSPRAFNADLTKSPLRKSGTQGGDFDNQPFALVGEQKEHLRRFIEQLAVQMSLQDPDMAASAAVLVIERAIVRTLITGA
jgi:hypothetical protein